MKKEIIICLLVVSILCTSCISTTISGDKYVYTGLNQYRNEEYLEAIESFEKAIELGVKRYELKEVYTCLGNTYVELEMYEEAILEHNRALELDDEYYKAWVNLGIAYRQKGDYDLAEEAYKKAIQINSNYAELHSSMGTLYILNSEPQKAIEEFEIAIELDPNLSVAYGNAALAYAMNGEFMKAEEYLNISKTLGYKNYKEIKSRIESLRQ